MTDLPMFPLGSVLFPYMPLQLRVFEERYLVMLSRILVNEPAEFGVVLIERGQEVGGGEQRFPLGTVAQVTELEATEEGFIGLVAQGDRRIEVVEWMPEDPHPRAVVRELDTLAWDDSLLPLLGRAERTVRSTLALASEFTDQAWAANVELSDDPVARAWQLAGIAPLGTLDQVTLLRSSTTEALLGSIIELTVAAGESLRASWPEEPLDLEEPLDPEG
ncbi:LON peptidase substrate-binding domain-containing protein [Lacisediminihabitans sp.]|uniref:LON peptidase substrate-binding domain-containing protein n=1 Tax=Lacisediminihabitans sp. TaxID=2787631 RepID=UPI00374D2834